MDKITLPMNAGEAIFALQAITDAAANARRIRRFQITTHAPADERAIADLSSEVLGRIELRLRALLFPECRYPGEEPCGRPVVEDGYCRLHADHVAKVAEILA